MRSSPYQRQPVDLATVAAWLMAALVLLVVVGWVLAQFTNVFDHMTWRGQTEGADPEDRAHD
jgi:hypothetical protein